MKIIIPMSGLGKRFVDVGYVDPKPLIKVNGKPIIEYVVSMFPGDHDFIFICNNDHIKNTEMKNVLEKIKPGSIIINIPKQKNGPVYAVTHAYDYINDDEEVMISYCDYFMEWDFEDVIKKIKEGNYDGAVPSYTGFHPHLLHKKLYGGVLADRDGNMVDYREKHSFTENPSDSFHSAGAYYFRTGKELKKYSDELLQSDINIGGEQYTSMVYYLYLRDNKKIYVPTVRRFMQWGTPEDLEEFEAWNRYFASVLNKEKGETSIPKEREDKISIPYDENGDMFKNSYDYWGNYFRSLN